MGDKTACPPAHCHTSRACSAECARLASAGEEAVLSRNQKAVTSKAAAVAKATATRAARAAAAADASAEKKLADSEQRGATNVPTRGTAADGKPGGEGRPGRQEPIEPISLTFSKVPPPMTALHSLHHR
eukprot:941419-Pleurochrysis_carterae.AAC.1